MQSQEKYYKEQIAELKKEIAGLIPDNSNYDIMEAKQIGSHLVMRVNYSSCKSCDYSEKVLVFLNTSTTDALKWKRIDPHFRKGEAHWQEAPSPAARFPATVQGWKDALDFTLKKTRE